MLKAILLALLLALTSGCGVVPGAVPATSVVPDWYYSSPCRQPEGVSLEQWLPHELPIEDYELDVFDCSELSAYAEWLAENCGYDTQIVVGRFPGSVDRHAWVVVDGRILDTETGTWDVDQCRTIIVLEDLAEAIEYEATEWLWWIARPGLKD